jgi:FemAB-related protein (PEP-CTERM system-associated)
MLTPAASAPAGVAPMHGEGQDTTVWAHRVVDELREPRLAHDPEWFTVIRHAYGHEPLYLAGEDESGRPGVLPAFVVRRPFAGTVVTSMPFLDSGGPCAWSPALATVLVERLLGEARRVGARAVELRCAERLPVAQEPADHKVNLTLPLSSDPDQLWQRLDTAVRTKVRKVSRAGLEVEFGGPEKLPAFYGAFAARMRDLGSPVHAYGFFHAVLASFGPRARIALVRKGDTPVGGLLALAFRDRLVVPWSACLKEHFASRPNMLLYWETLRTACTEGFRYFDFGRSTRGSGTYHFKLQWGAQEEPLFWYRIPLAALRGASAAGAGRGADLAVRAWQHLPLAVTTSLGPRIRRYLIQ